MLVLALDLTVLLVLGDELLLGNGEKAGVLGGGDELPGSPRGVERVHLGAVARGCKEGVGVRGRGARLLLLGGRDGNGLAGSVEGGLGLRAHDERGVARGVGEGVHGLRHTISGDIGKPEVAVNLGLALERGCEVEGCAVRLDGVDRAAKAHETAAKVG